MNTSDNSEKATMNFFLGSTEKKQLGITNSTNSKSDTYIIIQNDKLHAEVVNFVLNLLEQRLNSMKWKMMLIVLIKV